MEIKKIIYNNGKNEGYFVETRRGYMQITIREGISMKLNDIKKISNIRLNEVNLKVEEIKGENSYIN